MSEQAKASESVAWALVQRVAVNIRANLESLPYVAEVWADDLDQALAHLSAAVIDRMALHDALCDAHLAGQRLHELHVDTVTAEEYAASHVPALTAASKEAA